MSLMRFSIFYHLINLSCVSVSHSLASDLCIPKFILANRTIQDQILKHSGILASKKWVESEWQFVCILEKIDFLSLVIPLIQLSSESVCSKGLTYKLREILFWSMRISGYYKPNSEIRFYCPDIKVCVGNDPQSTGCSLHTSLAPQI